jgi:phosphoenolpyruvate synthase/pyruvate phosphate dikinase
MDHVRLVWASLWSDAALLYRRELGLDVSKSSLPRRRWKASNGTACSGRWQRW